MKQAYHILSFWLGMMAFTVMAGCSQMHDEADFSECITPQQADSSWLSLRLSVSSGAARLRTNPTGGEHGDGDEPGTANENTINGVTLFVFDADVDVNSAQAESAPILATYYFTQDQLKKDGEEYFTTPVQVANLGLDKLQVLVVANHDYSHNDNFKVLGSLRDHMEDYVGLWTGEGNESKNFLMSSVLPVTITGIQGSSQTQPAWVVANIQRLAARIDYKTEKEVFDVPGATDASVIVAQARVQGAVVVNEMQGGTHLFKHVASDVAGTQNMKYIGEETPVAGGDATNWVVDAYHGASATKTFNRPFASFAREEGWRDLFTQGFPVTDQHNVAWHCLGYARENVNAITSLSEARRWTTGVVFKVQYTPTGHTAGATFYVYKEEIYSTLALLDTKLALAPGTLTDSNCADYGITAYPGGICYYTWWIKHSGDADETTFATMEYATCRNSLYQLNVTAVKALGDAVPGDTPLTLQVAVKNWTVLPAEEVDLN